MSVEDGSDPHTRASTAVNEGRPVEAQYVRQGKKNGRIVVVLAISLGLAAILTFAMWWIQSPGLSGRGGQTSVDGRSFSQASPQAIQRPSQDPNAARRNSTDNTQH